MTVRWWLLLAVWPLAYALSVAGTVLAVLLSAVTASGELGAPGDARYVALWAAVLPAVPAAVAGVPVLVAVASVLRGAALGWQVLAVGWIAAWLAGGCAALVLGPWGPLGARSADPSDPAPWTPAALLVAIAALAWGLGTSAAWAAVRPVRPVHPEVGPVTVGRPPAGTAGTAPAV
jgi:hypothetical protein